MIFPENLLFPNFRETFYAGHVKLFRSVGSLHARRVSARGLSQNGARGVHPTGGQKEDGRRLLNLKRRENEGEYSSPLLQFPPLCTECCAVWCFHAAGLDSPHCLAESFRTRCFTFFNVCTYRCELTAAPLFKNHPQ